MCLSVWQYVSLCLCVCVCWVSRWAIASCRSLSQFFRVSREGVRSPVVCGLLLIGCTEGSASITGRESLAEKRPGIPINTEDVVLDCSVPKGGFSKSEEELSIAAVAHRTFGTNALARVFAGLEDLGHGGRHMVRVKLFWSVAVHGCLWLSVAVGGCVSLSVPACLCPHVDQKQKSSWSPNSVPKLRNTHQQLSLGVRLSFFSPLLGGSSESACNVKLASLR